MRVEHDRTARRFVAYGDDDARLGEIVYEAKDGDLWATHTRVGAAHRGQGIAEKLLDALADHAEKEEKKIVPVCSYVAAAFEREPARYATVAKSRS